VRAAHRLALLRDAGLAPKKSFGQNFLVADHVIAKIASACVPEAERGNAHVVELGAGLGALTAALIDRAAHVTAIERDRELVPLLRTSFQGAIEGETLEVVEADAQSVDLASLFRSGLRRVLAGNLPYQITGQLLRLAVDQSGSVDRVVFMIQREVKDRLVAEPGTKAYGALTIFVRAAFTTDLVMEVSPGAFVPPPNVSSSVVALTPRRERLTEETATFRAVVKAAFGARRKTLRNAWRPLCEAGPLEAAAKAADISLDDRGEQLDVDAFARMAAAIDALVVR
jgi:16S rRNA (adenine1518-N6/adenine1519-N6)-dimethyltransferase